MPELIESPVRVEAAGEPPKLIDEFAGRASNGEERVSVARMRSPAGWQEPGQRPEFDEYTVVLAGALQVETEGDTLEVPGGPGGAGAGRRVGALLDARRGRVRGRLPAGVLAGHRSSRRRLDPANVGGRESLSRIRALRTARPDLVEHLGARSHCFPRW